MLYCLYFHQTFYHILVQMKHPYWKKIDVNTQILYSQNHCNI